MPLNRSKLQKWSKSVRLERGNKCAICGSEPDGTYWKRIEAHHLQPIEYRPDLMLDVRNGIPLCRKCHCDIHDGVFNRVLTNYPTVTEHYKQEYQKKKELLTKCADEHGWTYPADPPLQVI